MTALNLSESKITHRQQIIQLLKMAISQNWPFSYVVMVKNHVETHPIRLVSVNAQDANFGVNQEIANTEDKSDEAIMFRAQSGGISVVFKSRLVEVDDKALNKKSLAKSYVALPYEVRCTQLRKTVRVNLENLEQPVPVLLYLAMGVQVKGNVVDISTSGAKFEVNENLMDKFRNPQALEACRIRLTDKFALQCGAQLMGMSYDSKSDISQLRCQLVEMNTEDEQALDAYINGLLDQADASQTVITS